MFIANIEIVNLDGNSDRYLKIVFTYRDYICVLRNNGVGCLLLSPGRR